VRPPPPAAAPTRTPRWLLLVAVVAVLALVAVVVADPLGRRSRSEPAPAPKKTKIVAEAPPSATQTRASPPKPEPIDPPTRPRALASVEIVDMLIGTGDRAASGAKVTVDYTGTLVDGTKFDESHGRGPFAFELGAGHVIKGFDQGVDGMRVGGKRRVTIPPELGYGERAMGKIPAGSTLIFELELRKVEWPGPKFE
jgi:FKBP-type peptidyl-prolyl cis-trans isomerase